MGSSADKTPNRVTRKTLDHADKGIELHTAQSVDDLFRQLNDQGHIADSSIEEMTLEQFKQVIKSLKNDKE